MRKNSFYKKGINYLRNPWFLAGIAFLSIAALVLFWIFRPYFKGQNREIPFSWGYSKLPPFKGSPFSKKPILDFSSGKHPYLAASSANNMHADATASDVHPASGPLGYNCNIQSYAVGRFGGECACVNFDSLGNMYAVCATFRDFSLYLFDPNTLSPITKYTLPNRKSSSTLSIRKIVDDSSGGAYFFIDRQNRVVLVDADQVLQIINLENSGGERRFRQVWAFPLREFINIYSDKEDVVTSILPDWHGRYWFVSRKGLIGMLDPATKKLEHLLLKNEGIHNSFACDSTGIFIVSDHALYGFDTRVKSKGINIGWKESYQRASIRKSGSFTLGSGTTPTLLGSEFIAISDNSDSRVNLLVYYRGFEHQKERLLCSRPLFENGKSVTENSFIGVGNSLIIENNHGYDLFPAMMFGKTATGGILRVDFNSTTATCDSVWQNPVISQTTVPKLSAGNGLVYTYTKDSHAPWGVDAYYLSSIDFESGKTIYELLVGTGVGFDNNWAPLTIGPDGCVYIGVLRGLVRVCDGQKSEILSGK